MERFAKIVKGWKLLTILLKSPISDAWQGSEYASVAYLSRHYSYIYIYIYIGFGWVFFAN